MNLFQNYNPPTFPPLFFFLLFVWSIIWQALALWRAVKNDQKNWFIGILVIGTSTFGTLAILYLFLFAKEKMTLEELKGFVTKFNK